MGDGPGLLRWSRVLKWPRKGRQEGQSKRKHGRKRRSEGPLDAAGPLGSWTEEGLLRSGAPGCGRLDKARKRIVPASRETRPDVALMWGLLALEPQIRNVRQKRLCLSLLAQSREPRTPVPSAESSREP